MLEGKFVFKNFHHIKLDKQYIYNILISYEVLKNGPL